MKRIAVSALSLAVALLAGCAAPVAQPAVIESEGSVLLAHATEASLGLSFPVGQATRAQVLASLGDPQSTRATTDGSSTASFTYAAGTSNCNHQRVLTHTAVFQFDASDRVAGISLRHGGQWFSPSSSADTREARKSGGAVAMR